MTSHIQIPKPVVVEQKMTEVKATGMKGMVGKRMTKKVKFMGEDLEIAKLNMAEVLQIQESAKSAEENKEGGDDQGISLVQDVIRSSVESAKDLSDEEFKTFPFDELQKLSEEIMKFSGLGAKADPK